MITAFERLLAQLMDAHSQEPAAVQLRLLSQLSRSEVQRVQEVWPQIPAHRRRKMVRAMVELAEDNIELNFDGIFRFCLEDPDAEVRAVSIDGLWECEDVELVGPLLRLLEQDESALVRTAAAEALGRFLLLSELGDISPVVGARIEQALLGAIQSPGEDLEVRRRAVESIAYSSEVAVNDLIEDAYYDEEQKMRVSAIFAMGRSADIRWRGYVERELFSPDPEIRYEAARACGELEHVGALPRLFELVEDEDAEVREAAIWAIGQIGGREAQRVLTSLLDHPDEAVSQAALEALEFLHFQMGTDIPLFEYDPSEDLGFLDDDLLDELRREEWDV
ncbi:MAG: HEAT repeat domain-containing protein [Anaerolineae bacterium]|nr:HEAT repeat domain-containing protein [Anaerolineae bacterium]